MLIAVLLLALAQPMAADPAPMDYADAKQLADSDEATVVGAAHSAMVAAQQALLDAGILACALGKPQSDFSRFTLVMRLDQAGIVQQTWRQGSSPLAICLQKYVVGKLVFVPPKAPFHTALDITFTP